MEKNYQSRDFNAPETFVFSELFSQLAKNMRILPTDFIVRLDLLGVLSADLGYAIEDKLYDDWDVIFPELSYDSILRSQCLNYYSKYRSGFKIMSHGDAITGAMRRIKTMIPVQLLLLLCDQSAGVEINPDMIERTTVDILSRYIDSHRTLCFRTHEIVEQYFHAGTMLDRNTRHLLSNSCEAIKNLSSKLKSSFEPNWKRNEDLSRTGSREDRRVDSIAWTSPVRMMQMVCLLELALEQRKNHPEASRAQLIESVWSSIFYDIPFTVDTARIFDRALSANDYLKGFTLLFDYSLGEIRNKRLFCIIIICRCVHQAIAQMPSETVAADVTAKAIELFKSNFNTHTVNTWEDDIAAYIKIFTVQNGYINTVVTELLQRYKTIIQNVFNATVNYQRACRIVSTKKVSPLLLVQIICLVELALEQRKSHPEASRAELIQTVWSSVFPRTPYSNPELSQIDNIIITQELLKPYNLLFSYPLKEIQNMRYVRSIVVCRCVHQAIALMPTRVEAVSISAEALELFDKNFSKLAIDKEEQDIGDYVSIFTTMSGMIDEHISKLLKQHKEIIQNAFSDTVTATEGRIAKTATVFEALGQEVGDLKAQLEQSKSAALMELVEKLASPTYGYILGRLYRVSNGIEEINGTQFQNIARDLLRVLMLFGIVPFEGDAVGKSLAEMDIDSEQCDYAEYNVTGQFDDTLLFPGWRVAGDLVAFPVINSMNGQE